MGAGGEKHDVARKYPGTSLHRCHHAHPRSGQQTNERHAERARLGDARVFGVGFANTTTDNITYSNVSAIADVRRQHPLWLPSKTKHRIHQGAEDLVKAFRNLLRSSCVCRVVQLPFLQP